jgi:putative hydrolase of HD superfamily
MPTELLKALAQVGSLKDLRRAGWVRKGLPEAETVAAHSFRAAVLALVFAGELGVDPARLLGLVLAHDLPESDPGVGDITPFCGVEPGEKRRRERAAMERLCARLPDGDRLLGLWLEYDEGRSPEAQVAHQLDALEMALQAREYEERHGVDLSEFVASARAKVRHPSLVRLLEGAP